MYLAVHTDRLSSIREIATAYGISENHLMKIIHRLALGGFIETIRGRGGGMRLARPASAIRIGDVVRHTEEDMALVGCLQSGGAKDTAPCLLADACRLRGALGEALGSFMTVLDGYTLADVVTSHERQRLA